MPRCGAPQVQCASVFDNRDSKAIDALVMTVFMATSC